jgi:MoxR-like ATPase
MSEHEGAFAKKLDDFRANIDALMKEVGRVIYGQEETLKQMLSAVFARGHCLLVGVPGLAKTLMVSSLAQTMALSFKRIQFTPDLMPGDITGTNIIEEIAGHREFRFMPGPIFAHIVLADEINRTPPKTQAALLQAMQERQVSIGQETYDLPQPFFVIATQNPIEQEGTYPLPEAQLDRFMFNIYVDYPSEHIEEKILEETTRGERPELRQVLNGQQILAMQRVVEKIVASKYVIQYATQLVRLSRPNNPKSPEYIKQMVDWGAGPRAGQYLILGAKAIAAMDGRVNIAVSDIKDVAVPVLRHRIAANFQAQAEGVDSTRIVQMLLADVPEPDIPRYEKAH